MSRDPVPYDLSKSFDAAEFLDGFTEERRIVYAVDDPELARMVEIAWRAWAAFARAADREVRTD